MKRIGQCKRCGRCCQVKTLWKGLNRKTKIFLCILRPKLIFTKGRCDHLKFENGMAKCEIYDKRPLFCRLFPDEPADLVDDRCGYKFISK